MTSFQVKCSLQVTVSYFLAARCFSIRLGEEGKKGDYGMVHVCSCAYKTSFLSCKVVQVIAETDEWRQGRRNVVCKSLPLFDCKTSPAISLLFRRSDMLGEAAASPYPFCPSSRHYQCTAWVQHRMGASDAGPGAPRHHGGAVTTCRLCPLRHTREQAETGILWWKKWQYTCHRRRVRHLPFETSQAATACFIMLSSSFFSKLFLTSSHSSLA